MKPPPFWPHLPPLSLCRRRRQAHLPTWVRQRQASAGGWRPDASDRGQRCCCLLSCSPLCPSFFLALPLVPIPFHFTNPLPLTLPPPPYHHQTCLVLPTILIFQKTLPPGQHGSQEPRSRAARRKRGGNSGGTHGGGLWRSGAALHGHLGGCVCGGHGALPRRTAGEGQGAEGAAGCVGGLCGWVGG